MSIVEITITSAILVVVLFATFGIMQRDSELSKATIGIQIAETRAQQMLYELQSELADARGERPIASVAESLESAGTTLVVDDTLGFPDQGVLVLARGTETEERIAYTGLEAGRTQFLELARGEQCTDAASHPIGTPVLWSGLAEPLALQEDPPADAFDGIARIFGREIFFRGDGTGFSYRVPTDPEGGIDYLQGDDLQWGADVEGEPRLSGWTALYFAPRYAYFESATGDDLNGDGDVADAFDVGQIRRRSWDTADPNARPLDLGLGPTVVLQEQCAFGSDLDADGFEDPIFLWDSVSRQLHVRLFIIGQSIQSMPVVRSVETTIFLRNEPDN
jgi:hypothetical protein